MNKLLIIALAVGAVLAFSLAASAQYVPPGEPGPVLAEPAPIPAPADQEAIFAAGPVRIVPIDPMVASQAMNRSEEAGRLARVQAEVASDPVLAEELAAANIPINDVFDVATDTDGVTTIYVIG